MSTYLGRFSNNGVEFNQQLGIFNIKFCISGKFKNLVDNEQGRASCMCYLGCLDIGKPIVRAVCELFGGIYRDDISGQTKLLVIGDEPGVTKITNAQSLGDVCIVNFEVYYS